MAPSYITVSHMLLLDFYKDLWCQKTRSLTGLIVW